MSNPKATGMSNPVEPLSNPKSRIPGLIMEGNKVGVTRSVQPNVIDAVSPSVRREDYGKISIEQPAPVYNPSIHRPGDRVLVQRGKRWVEMVIPRLDADGQAIYE